MCSHHSCISGSYFHTSAAVSSQLDVQFPYGWWWNERNSGPCFWLPLLYQQDYKAACCGAAMQFISLCVPPNSTSHGKSLAEHRRGMSTPPLTFLFHMVFPREAKKSHTINPILNRWHRRWSQSKPAAKESWLQARKPASLPVHKETLVFCFLTENF